MDLLKQIKKTVYKIADTSKDVTAYAETEKLQVLDAAISYLLDKATELKELQKELRRDNPGI
jgi:hypothetical protein